MGIMDAYKSMGGEHVEGETTGVSRFMKGADFEGEGQKVVVVGCEKFIPSDPQYGVKNNYGAGGVVVKQNWFVKEGILEEGQSFKYRFTQDGNPKEFDNNSVSFFFAFKQKNPAEGAEVTIKRTKNPLTPTDVKWTLI
jgi:hypothetical protein